MGQPGPALNSETVNRDVIVIGASAGGVEALVRLFSLLPRDLPATIGCVLHRGMIPSRLVDVLARQSSLSIRELQTGETVQRGTFFSLPLISTSSSRHTASRCNVGNGSTVPDQPSIRYFAQRRRFMATGW